LVLSSRTPPATVVIALGSNSMSVQRDQVRPPTATDAGTQIRLDPAGRYRVTGLDSPADVTREVDRIMALVPKTTTVYWVGVWLDDKLWGEVPWRAQNAAMRQAVQRYGNAHFLDWAGFVESAHVPILPDGTHPTPAGMVSRARWIVSQLH
jgi:lysophospholipase L1-like esterase